MMIVKTQRPLIRHRAGRCAEPLHRSIPSLPIYDVLTLDDRIGRCPRAPAASMRPSWADLPGAASADCRARCLRHVVVFGVVPAPRDWLIRWPSAPHRRASSGSSLAKVCGLRLDGDCARARGRESQPSRLTHAAWSSMSAHPIRASSVRSPSVMLTGCVSCVILAGAAGQRRRSNRGAQARVRVPSWSTALARSATGDRRSSGVLACTFPLAIFLRMPVAA